MKALSSVLVALALLAGSGSVLADSWHDHDRGQDRDDHGDRDRGHDRDGWHDRDGRHDRDGWRGDDGWRRERDGDHDRHAYWDRRYDGDRVYDDHPRWTRGYRYDGPMAIVNDYGYYRLSPPPYGYRWVRADNDYLLVSIGDNVILDLVIR